MIYIYIVNNHGVELKAKAPPSIWLCYVSDWNCHWWYIGTCNIHIKLWHHVIVHFNQINPTSYVHYNQIEKGHDFIRLRGGLINLDSVGKSMCHHSFCSPSLVSSNHHLNCFVVIWGIYLLAGKPLRSRLHSLHDVPFGLRMVFSLSRSGAFHFPSRGLR